MLRFFKKPAPQPAQPSELEMEKRALWAALAEASRLRREIEETKELLRLRAWKGQVNELVSEREWELMQLQRQLNDD